MSRRRWAWACGVFFLSAVGAQAAVTLGPTGGHVAAVAGVRALERGDVASLCRWGVRYFVSREARRPLAPATERHRDGTHRIEELACPPMPDAGDVQPVPGARARRPRPRA